MIKLKGNKELSINDEKNSYLKPKYVYIPLICSNDTDITIILKKGDYVYKGQIIGHSKGNFSTNIISSVSGFVSDFTDKTYLNNKMVKCCVIENDYKEAEKNKDIRDKINDISKTDFIDIIKKCGIIGMGGAGFPTYIKYNTDKKIKTLIVNAVECEPYITADYNLITKYPEEILEAIDAIITINKIDEAIIAIKKTNTKLIKILNNYIGSYLKIKIVSVPNRYPMGWEKTLIKTITHKDYEKLPSDIGIIVNNVSTVYAIYRALKYNESLTERIITITGLVNKPQNILVKIGSSASEIIKSISGVKDKNALFVAGGPMMGTNIPSHDIVITANINCILLIDNNIPISNSCMRCGKCINVCPSKILPVLIMDHCHDAKELKKYQVNKCIECGLCSYICPSKINVREYVKIAKEEVKNERN